jgi:beta-galactosidase
MVAATVFIALVYRFVISTPGVTIMLQRRDVIKAGLVLAATASLAESTHRAPAQSAAVSAALAAAGPRRRELMDAHWLFQAQRVSPSHHPLAARQAASVAIPETAADFNDAAWRVVQLPHDYIVEGKYSPKAHRGHGFLPVYPAWYRKHFHLPAADSGKSVWIDFEGVYRDAHVYLNGQFLGRHGGGYTPFRFDISKAANFGGNNVLAVHVDPTKFEGWWYEGGGIYRHVWLNVADHVHVEPWGVYVVSEVHDVAAQPSADLTISTSVVNQSQEQQPCTIQSDIFDPLGNSIATMSGELTIAAGQSANLKQIVQLPHVSLWSLEDRNIYTLVTQVYRGGALVDSHTQRFGIRTLRYDAKTGFYLNEKHVELQGTCNHQDFVGVGIGAPDSLWYWRVRKLKEIGCNAIRCSHNIMAPAFYDACDELGMLVMDENRRLGDGYGEKTHVGEPYKKMWHVDEMVLRDRNHPSIIMWSLCNEEYMVQNTSYGKKVFAALMKSVHQYDRTRPITCAMSGNWSKARTHGWDATEDFQHLHGFETVENLQGCNYDPFNYDRFHRAYPHLRMFGSEIGSNTSDRGVYKTDIPAGLVSAYHGNPQKSWQPVATRPFIAGGFVWTGFDYRGEPTPCGWPSINSHFGLLDMCGFRKDVAMYYQAWWGDKPLVHIFPHWNWPGQEGKTIRVWCYSNCDEIELRVNGISHGRKKMPRLLHLQWDVQYQPGHIEAYGYNKGVLTALHRIETTGTPAAILLTPDRYTLRADGQDTVPVAVSLVDSAGRIVPTANNRVRFSVSGAGINAGVGNGDPACLEPNQAAFRSAFNGLCMVLARANHSGGIIRVRASADGLKPAGVELLAKT